MIQNYTTYEMTQTATNKVVNVTTGLIVAGGRINRHWEGIEPNYKTFFKKVPDDIENKVYNDPASFIEFFGLHSVEFGNWLNQIERREFMSAGADCLMQIAKILKVPYKSVGLNRKLSVSFGARGTGGKASAHYEPKPYCIINITKPHARYGSFLHEYAHAIDNLTSVYTGGKYGMTTVDMKDIKNEFTLLMSKIFKNLYYNKNGELSDFKKYLNETSDYWKRDEEVWARTSEKVFSGLVDKFYNYMFIKNSSEYNDRVYPPSKIVDLIEDDVYKFFKRTIHILNSIPLKDENDLKIKEIPKTEPIEPEKPKFTTLDNDSLEILVFISKNKNANRDEIAVVFDMQISTLLVKLTELEFKGYILQAKGNVYNISELGKDYLLANQDSVKKVANKSKINKTDNDEKRRIDEANKGIDELTELLKKAIS